MKSLRYILSVTLLLCLSISTDIVEAKNPSILENGIDVILADLRQRIMNRNMDGIPLPSSEDSFSATLFQKELDGHVWVGDGQIKGISSIHRSGNVTFGRCPDDRTVYQFQIAVGLTDLQAKYSLVSNSVPSAATLESGSKFPPSASTSQSSPTVSEDLLPILQEGKKKYTIKGIKFSYKITLNGIGFFDTKLYSMLIDFVTIIFATSLHGKIENVVCQSLTDAFIGEIQHFSEFDPASII
ncbi:hypothetical protein Avbf_11931 [Armadillidium vulgare]|nr:hypothetical protein Avbf_11931 [Armadillidium vulgare]